ncbi:hypothetical protein [Actinomadura atramentaria]|uniref:hypothetical protein n=1 Tax=Actinomadura atramentaria TaxID=1990 RepID=UPI00037DB45F|nr:hypothetical protein [Actinomadura atramentaria]
MCVSTAAAEFSGTILYGGRRRHPVHGLIEVVGYQNTAVNLHTGPNAMLLHLPARALTPGQFVPVGRHGDVLTRMVDAVRPVPAGGIDWMGSDEPSRVQVFEHDVYTVLLADDPTLIPAALHRVPPRRRPPLRTDLLEFYADAYPGHVMAVCCFDNADARRAKPLLLWYEPTDPDRIVLPALDCHTGAPPDLDRPVPTDHWILFGLDDAGDDWGEPVEYPGALRHELREFLPRAVLGTEFTAPLPNGDFAVAVDDLRAGRLNVERVR